MIVTFTSTRIDVPVTGAWDVATYVANPRMSSIRITMEQAREHS